MQPAIRHRNFYKLAAIVGGAIAALAVCGSSLLLIIAVGSGAASADIGFFGLTFILGLVPAALAFLFNILWLRVIDRGAKLSTGLIILEVVLSLYGVVVLWKASIELEFSVLASIIVGLVLLTPLMLAVLNYNRELKNS